MTCRMENDRASHRTLGIRLLVVLLLLIVGCDREPRLAEQLRDGTSTPVSLKQRQEVLPIAGELLVQIREQALSSLLSRHDALREAKVVHTYRFLPNLHVLRFPRGTDLEQALATLKRDSLVLYVERNSRYSTTSEWSSKDPLFLSQWSLNNTGQNGGTVGADIGAPHAWNLTTGDTEAVLGVIDTGLDYTHPDLLSNVWQNLEEIPGNGRDDDGNGYVDDIHGINAITHTGDPMDDNGHGTHVAGILGAVGNNKLGVAGINWNTKIIPCKFLDKTGNGTEADALKCLDYFLALKNRSTHPVNVIATNNSWSCRSASCESAALREAILGHMNAGILFMAAAGNVNTNIDVAESWPAKYRLPNMLVVAATDRKDVRWGSSSYGRQTVHLGAPGVEILSTIPNNDYRVFSGTSMATPHVTGVAGLLAAQDSTRDWKAIKNLLLAGGQPLASLSDVTLTGRRLLAWGPSANGALNCAGQKVTRRLQPIAPSQRLSAAVGHLIPLSVLNINCATPGGGVSVQVSGQQEITVSLSDKGLAGDQASGDGIYTGQFTPEAPGAYLLTFPDGEQFSLDVFSPYGPAEQRPFRYEDLTGSVVRADGAGDETNSLVPLPFPIPFGDLYPGFSKLYVNSNGYISFTPLVSNSTNVPLPSKHFSSAIFPFWYNLEVPEELPAGLYYGTLGVEPHRKFVVEWRDVGIFSVFPSQPLKFQVVFFEDSSDIAFNYASVLYGSEDFPELDNGGTATVGLQLLPTVAQQYSHVTPSLSNATSIVFKTLPAPNVPVVSSLTALTEQPRSGEPITLQASFEELNQQDGPWKIEWTCNHDGKGFVAEQEQQSAEQGTVRTTCFYRQGGSYTVALRVTGQFGASSKVRSTTFTVAGPPPRIRSFHALPLSGNEPLQVRFEVVAVTEPAGAVSSGHFEYRWDFDGNGTFDAITREPHVGHLYTDNPARGDTFTARVQVWSLDGTAEATLQVTVANVPPRIGPISHQQPSEGVPYWLQLSASDPGVDDTLSFVLERAPEGMSLDATGLLLWTPAAEQCGEGRPYDVAVKVTDKDGGEAHATFTLQVACQNANAPGAPTLVSPKQGEVIQAAFPVLTLQNVSHEEGVPFTYDFELMEAGAESRQVDFLHGVMEQAGGKTSVTFSQATLSRGKTYAWRARATSSRDGAGTWTEPNLFQVENDLSVLQPDPSAPRSGCSTMPGDSARAQFLLLALAVLLYRHRGAGQPR
ncbi:S8 family serine peptidase [Archangium gephyra]|nr:S8 family serine peptidase [Archangium gephyra]